MEEWSPFRAYAPARKRGLPWQDACAAFLLAAAAIWLFYASRGLPQYDWQWPLLGEFLLKRNAQGELIPGLLLRGLFTTLRIGIYTIVFSFILGGLIGIASARKSLLASMPAHLYINLLRNTPPLIILFALYFAAGNILPMAAIEDVIRQWPETARQAVAMLVAPPGQLDRMLAAILALGCYQAAYVAEITRAGIESVPQGQRDAAMALGFGGKATLFYVIMPQAAALMLPPLTGQCISIFKESALAALISLPDLTFQSLEIMATSSMTLEIWIAAATLYLLIGMICALIGRWLERRYRRIGM